MRRLALGVAGSLVLIAGTTACDDSSGSEDTLTVLAASSLTEAFGELEKRYEENHDVDVEISYDSSSVLAAQVLEGAPADVLATADDPTMRSVVDEGLTDGGSTNFATNTLTVVTPPQNPAGIEDIDDLDDPDVKYAVCVPEAPCGNASERLLELNAVGTEPATEEENVKSVLTKVTLGEVDAGLVYASDAQAAGDDVTTVRTANAAKVVNSDPIAVLADTDDAGTAHDWVEYVLSDEGSQVLRSYGFDPAS